MEQMHCCSCLFCTFPRLVIKLGNSSVWQGSASFGCCFLLPLLSPVHLISCPVLKSFICWIFHSGYIRHTHSKQLPLCPAILLTTDTSTKRKTYKCSQECAEQTNASVSGTAARTSPRPCSPPKCSATRTDERETYLSLLLLAVQLPVLDLQPGLGHALRPQLATLAQTHSAADERQLSQYGKCSRWMST